jgi:hypothetical protein
MAPHGGFISSPRGLVWDFCLLVLIFILYWFSTPKSFNSVYAKRLGRGWLWKRRDDYLFFIFVGR